MNIPGFIDMVTQKIANLASGKTRGRLRQFYGLPNEFAPDEEPELKRRFQLEEAQTFLVHFWLTLYSFASSCLINTKYISIQIIINCYFVE